MRTNLLANPIVPIASPHDAVETYEQLRVYFLQTEFVPIVVHVIEKAGGAPDKASVEQRGAHAEQAFDEFRKRAQMDGVNIETKLLYGSDIADTIHTAAADLDASAIVFTSRGGNRWLNLVSGNVRAKLIAHQRRPVIVLPRMGNNE